MNFIYAQYFLPLIILIIILSVVLFRSEKKFYIWIKDHWFYKRNLKSYTSTFLYVLGFSLLAIGLLDLRGPEIRVKGNVVDQKTIILVDSSASMLAEDVRPNRFNKALLLVKHYVKKAVGQKISLVVFSDNQKRIVPFTDDIDLIKARIDRLENLKLGRGGTGLTQAIQESIQYFRNSTESMSGNILIFTDAEETELSLDINIPDSISIGLVGVGTVKGAPVPQRDRNGNFIGNKKFNGELVISKLNEDFMKSLGDKIKNYNYWIASSYSLPTEEILYFFQRIDEIKKSEEEYRIKPIFANYLLIPGLILLICAFSLRFSKPFAVALLLLSVNIQANEENQKVQKEKSKITKDLLVKFAKNDLDKNEMKSLAFNLLNDKFFKESRMLYKEKIVSDRVHDDLQSNFNLALAQIQSKELTEGINLYKDLLVLLDDIKGDTEVDKFKLSVRKNLLKALDLQSQGGGKGKSGKQDDKDKDSKSNKNNKGKSDDSKSDNKNKKNNQGNSSDSDSKQSKDQGASDKDEDKKKKDQQKNKKNKGNQKDKNNDNKKSEQSNKSKSAKKSKKKLPAILKQLMSDDNQLQKKIIDARTTERNTRNKKDW